MLFFTCVVVNFLDLLINYATGEIIVRVLFGTIICARRKRAATSDADCAAMDSDHTVG